MNQIDLFSNHPVSKADQAYYQDGLNHWTYKLRECRDAESRGIGKWPELMTYFAQRQAYDARGLAGELQLGPLPLDPRLIGDLDGD